MKYLYTREEIIEKLDEKLKGTNPSEFDATKVLIYVIDLLSAGEDKTRNNHFVAKKSMVNYLINEELI